MRASQDKRPQCTRLGETVPISHQNSQSSSPLSLWRSVVTRIGLYGTDSGQTISNISGRIWAQNVVLTNKRSFFQFQVARNFVFPNSHTNRAKSVEFGLFFKSQSEFNTWSIIALSCCIFPIGSYIWSQKIQIVLMKIKDGTSQA